MQVFHLRSSDACEKLNIAPNTLKRICKRLSIGRWPARKLSSLASLKEDVQKEANKMDIYQSQVQLAVCSSRPL